ncbi:MAG: hypothetical protein QXV57_05710 [Thermoproteota archaeon]
MYKDKLRMFDPVFDASNLKYAYLYKHDEDCSLKLIGLTYPYQALGYQSAPPLPCPNFVVTSEALGQAVSTRLSVSYRVVHYGVPEVLGSNPSCANYLMYLGRMVKGKGPHLFVDLCRRLRNDGILVGEDVAVQDTLQ